jgi:tryptophan synthase alpha chain
MLEAYIRQRLQTKPILLMTHIVIGYPSFDASRQIVDAMVAAGVDLMELQIPFSEPIADGPVILRANQQALAAGARVARCLDFAAEVAQAHDIPFLFMSYYNILYRFGVQRFAAAMAERKLAGAIVPDLPPEEGRDYLNAMQSSGLAPILLLAPTTPPERIQSIAARGRGFLYCVARKGVTGAQTHFADELDAYLARCRQLTRLPLALGFGVKDAADVGFLKGRVEIAVVGSEMIRRVEEAGVAAVGAFTRELACA